MKKTSNALLTEIERQQKALKELPKDFLFPLFNTRRAVESQRRSGYRNTAAAAREIVDNALEAGAKKVQVIFDYPRERSKHERAEAVTGIAFIDDGSGMIPDMARYALTWGGGTHFDDHDFIGKFGFGLPNASINQCKRVDVYTRTSSKEKFSHAYLDIEEYSEHGIQSIPPADEAELPAFVQEFLDRNREKLDHGTVVVWTKLDRLSMKMKAPLKEHLVDDFGVVYRYLLPNFDLLVEGQKVDAMDPLFLTPGSRYYVPSDQGGAQCTHEMQIAVKYVVDPATGERHLQRLEDPKQVDMNDPQLVTVGNMSVKIARFPFGFVLGKRGKKDARTDAHRRFDVRRARRGMSFVRADREIETVDVFPKGEGPKSRGMGNWPLLQGYAYHWGIEVKFDPNLDEPLGIANDKQKVSPNEDFWRVLTECEIDRWVREEEQFQDKERTRAAVLQPSGEPTPAELAATSADTAIGKKNRVPDRNKPDARAALEKAAQERAKLTKETVDNVLAALEKDLKRRHYQIDYFDSVDGPFYVPEYLGEMVVVKINRLHPFYDAFYGQLLKLSGGRRAKEGIDLVLLALAKGELSADEEEMQLWYETQRKEIWSPFLARAIKSLAQQMKPVEEEGDQSAA
jgi:Histidine kinase-, DNA gyrase B-, and HSP90-like ATPase